jgi:hypothetical protein
MPLSDIAPETDPILTSAVTLCMPLYTSYILQPLNVGCFALLKLAYKGKINVLANSNITYINKKAFLDNVSDNRTDQVTEPTTFAKPTLQPTITHHASTK